MFLPSPNSASLIPLGESEVGTLCGHLACKVVEEGFSVGSKFGHSDAFVGFLFIEFKSFGEVEFVKFNGRRIKSEIGHF